MRRAYETWNPSGESRIMLSRANQICEEYAEDGYDLTLRQLYYQFVARGWLPNQQRAYKRLGDIVNRGRMAGGIDWDHITDRTRNLDSLPHWATAGDLMRSAAQSFHQDLWEDQPTRVEVWVEKEALAGVVERVARRWDVPFFSCRGYVSQSEQWRAGRRIGGYLNNGQNVVVLHLGDHDPSGIDMTRDIRDRLDTFTVTDWHHAHAAELGDSTTRGAIWDNMRDRLGNITVDPLEVRRIALNWDQIEEYDPPPNPTKLTDSRAEGYVDEHGYESWELDALDPRTLDALIDDHISAEVDHDLFSAAQARQEQIREAVTALADRPWDDVTAWLDQS